MSSRPHASRCALHLAQLSFGPETLVSIKRMKVPKITRQAMTPVACIILLALALAYAFTWIPNSVADSGLYIVLDSQTVRRLLVEQGKRDKAGDAIWEMKKRPITDMLEHPEKYTAGRSQFLQRLASEPGLALPNDTYLWTSEQSTTKCNLDAVSTTVFEKVRVVGWRNHGKEGWTCGPARPLLNIDP